MPHSPLHALTDLAARLADASDLDAVMPDVLSRAATALGARRCAVWWARDDGALAPRWGDAPAEGPEIVAVPLRAGGRTLGMLAVEGAPAASGDALGPRAVADVLAPTLSAARRTNEVEAHDRFIGCVIDSLPFG